jgi:hypothetical protein
VPGHAGVKLHNEFVELLAGNVTIQASLSMDRLDVLNTLKKVVDKIKTDQEDAGFMI